MVKKIEEDLSNMMDVERRLKLRGSTENQTATNPPKIRLVVDKLISTIPPVTFKSVAMDCLSSRTGHSTA